MKLGFEGEVFTWLDLRLGAVSYWQDFWNQYELSENNDTTFYLESRRPENETYLGLGLHFGRLTIDTYANPELFLNGFDFLSGEGRRMNAGISALYSF